MMRRNNHLLVRLPLFLCSCVFSSHKTLPKLKDIHAIALHTPQNIPKGLNARTIPLYKELTKIHLSHCYKIVYVTSLSEGKRPCPLQTCYYLQIYLHICNFWPISPKSKTAS